MKLPHGFEVQLVLSSHALCVLVIVYLYIFIYTHIYIYLLKTYITGATCCLQLIAGFCFCFSHEPKLV